MAFIERSTALRNYMAGTGSFAAAMDEVIIYVFSGPVPPDADAAVDGSCVLLAAFTVDDDGVTGGTWDDAGVSLGQILKSSTEDWAATGLANGTPTFFRGCLSGDDGTGAATTQRRIQGTVGDGPAYVLQRSGNPPIATSEELHLNMFGVELP